MNSFTNFNYEHWLQTGRFQLEWELENALNLEFNFLYLWLGEGGSFYPLREYTEFYLDLIRHFRSSELPAFSTDAPVDFWVGPQRDLAKERFYNSKFEFPKLLSMLPQPPSILLSPGDPLPSDFAPLPLVLKTEFSSSGRGIRVFKDRGKLDDFLKQTQQPWLVQPWLPRERDFSVVRWQGKHYYLRQLIDDKGRFWGCLHLQEDPPGELPLEVLEGLETYSLDGFQGEQRTYYCELNARRTMGTMGLALEALFKRKRTFDYWSLVLLRPQDPLIESLQQLEMAFIQILSPAKNQFHTYFIGLRKKELKRFAQLFNISL